MYLMDAQAPWSNKYAHLLRELFTLIAGEKKQRIIKKQLSDSLVCLATAYVQIATSL